MHWYSYTLVVIPYAVGMGGAAVPEALDEYPSSREISEVWHVGKIQWQWLH